MTIKEINEALEEGESLKIISQAYSEIADLKIKKIRSNVERNRLFFDEILKVYEIVKAIAIKKKVSLEKPKKKLYLLLTSNYRFYGSINSSLINYFIGSTRQIKDIDRVILGKGGIDYFRATKILPDFSEVILKKDMPSSEELSDLVETCSGYNQVLVFYSRFISLMIQQATSTDITATSLYTREFYLKPFNKRQNKDSIRYIFEPDIAKMLKFFDTQILTLLLEGTFLESELSRTASRFISMDQAETEANKFIKEYKMLKAYTERGLTNNKILENFATMIAVRQNDL